MASKTKVTTFRRERKLAKKGRKRKAKLRAQGTTKSPAVLFGDN